jgi:hypothetical protein
MSTIVSQNWDSVTTPALPSGWTSNGGTGVVTASGGITPISSPNMIVVTSGTGSSQQTITWGTQDGNAGNVAIVVTGQFVSSGAMSFSALVRGSANPIVFASDTFYEFRLENSAFQINKVVAGSVTNLFNQLVTGIANSVWYQITGQISGGSSTTLTAIVKRLTDGYYLNMTTGYFGSTPASVSYTDSSSPITGQGYVAWAASTGTHAGDQVYGDDFNLYTYSTVLVTTEGHDVFAASGGFTSPGALAKTESRDTFAGASHDYYGALSRTESHDTFAATGAANYGGSLAPTERHDVASMFARVSPFMRATEHRDTFSATATTGAATNSLAGTSGPDIFAAFGGFSYDGRAYLLATESRDIFAGHGFEYGPGAMATTERHDVFASAVVVTTHASMATTEAGDTFLGGLERVAYHVYANTGAGDPINYNSIIDTTAGLTYTTAPLSYPGTWSFGVRAFYVISGLEEKNLDCYVTFILDANGRDVTNRPAPPTAVRAFPLAGGTVRAEWIYPPTKGPKTPTGFHIYTGVGTLSYTTPTATVAWGTGVANSFVANMSGFSDGVTYTVGVRAFNAVAEETNTNVVTVTAIASGPAPVDDLVGVATAQA